MQVGLLQGGCTLYEYFILRACNGQRLRMFGVLLALPSATIRVMSSRPCQVITAAWLRLVYTWQESCMQCLYQGRALGAECMSTGHDG